MLDIHLPSIYAKNCAGQSNNLWVEFKSGRSSGAQGFQLTVLSVQGECEYPVQ